MSMAISFCRMLEWVQEIVDIFGRLMQLTIEPNGDEELRQQIFFARKPIDAFRLVIRKPTAYTEIETVGYLKIAIDHQISPMLSAAGRIMEKGGWSEEVRTLMAILVNKITELRARL